MSSLRRPWVGSPGRARVMAGALHWHWWSCSSPMQLPAYITWPTLKLILVFSSHKRPRPYSSLTRKVKKAKAKQAGRSVISKFPFELCEAFFLLYHFTGNISRVYTLFICMFIFKTSPFPSVLVAKRVTNSWLTGGHSKRVRRKHAVELSQDFAF